MRGRIPIMFFAFSLLPNALLRPQHQSPRTGQALPVVRSPHSTKRDLAVPLCQSAFEDGIVKNGIAFRGDESVIPPQPTTAVEAKMTHEALSKVHGPFDFEVVLSFVVDPNGTARNICLSHSVGYGLDESAAMSLTKTRFTPATNRGIPIPFRTDIEVAFRSY
jgi:TonB family protein